MRSKPKTEISALTTALRQLRPYQLSAVDEAMKGITHGARGLIVMPTGAGKSHVIAGIVERLQGKQILVITPRRRLLAQARALLGHHGVLSSKLGNDLGGDHRVVAGTYQTMTRRPAIVEPDVIIIDECHLLPPEGDYAELVRRYPNAAVIGLTATPFRGRQHIKHSGIRWQLLYSISMIELIDMGLLVRPVSMSTSQGIASFDDATAPLTEITTRIIPNLRASMMMEKRRHCLVFCTDISHAEFTARLLRDAGEASVHMVHSDQTSAVQDAEIHAFQSAAGRAWLVNVNLISVGVDIPCVDCIAILRNISSLALLIQLIGRGLRLCGDKRDCLVWDFGNGTRRFGFIDDPVLDVKRAGIDPVPLRTCPCCNVLMHASSTECPRCRHRFPRLASLRAAASEVQLLSAEYMIASYGGARVGKDAKGIWIVEHQLDSGGHTLLSTTVARTEDDARQSVRAVGTSVLVKRMSDRRVKLITARC